jgi:hypothetical protein
MSEYLVISQSLQNQEQEQIIRKSEPEPESPPTNQVIHRFHLLFLNFLFNLIGIRFKYRSY